MPQVRLDRGAPAGMQGMASARDGDCSEPMGGLYRKLKPGPGKDASQVADHQRTRIHSAMLELVAENGYEAVTVRDLARAAGVSTRSFYKHYSSKEQCFLRVLQLATQRALRFFERPRECEADEDRIRHAIGALASEPMVVRLLCVDAYAAGPVALRHAESARQSIETAIRGSFGKQANGSSSSLVAEAILAGVYSAARSYYLDGRELPNAYLSATLMPWITACCENLLWPEEMARLSSLDAAGLDTSFTRVSDGDHHVESLEASKGNRTVLLRAVTKLATSGDHQTPTLTKLLKTAGVSKRVFHSNFSSPEECLVEAAKLRADDVLACIQECCESAPTLEEGSYRAVATLCSWVTSDKALASLCFDASVASGISGMHFRQATTYELTAVLADQLETVYRADRSTVQIAAGSTWGMIQNHVTSGRARDLRRKAPALTYLLLAPIIGPASAMETLNQGHALTT